MKTTKCVACDKRYYKKEWHKGIERRFCFTCCVTYKSLCKERGITIREEKVIDMRFGDQDGQTHTLEEVGREFDVTRERIRQIECKAIEKISILSKLYRQKKYETITKK